VRAQATKAKSKPRLKAKQASKLRQSKRIAKNGNKNYARKD
jgi:hypothetical protein